MDILNKMEQYMEKFIDPVAGDLSITDDQFKYIQPRNRSIWDE